MFSECCIERELPSPNIVEGGMKRRVRDPVTKKRAREQSDVDCNAQK
jgi:hypothetical protein